MHGSVCLFRISDAVVWFVAHRHTLEELEQLVETAKQAVPNVDAAIAAAIDRKVNPVSLGPTSICCSSVGSKQD